MGEQMIYIKDALECAYGSIVSAAIIRRMAAIMPSSLPTYDHKKKQQNEGQFVVDAIHE